MCGILGIFSRDSSNTLDRRVAGGLQELKHRGPDAQDRRAFPVADGVCHLGHTRLSIIDLSSAGLQPMTSADGQYVIVFNGEIYNYLELRSELQLLGYHFVSKSDTEVLIAAWAAWGEACLPRLTGMFAFTVLDREKATLTCVRDAFGIKPLFYSCETDMFCFASEAPALVSLRGRSPALNWQRAYDYLVHGDYDSTEESFFEGVFQLAPGHVVQIDLSRSLIARPRRWWTPKITERHDLSFDEAAERVRTMFLDSVRLHLRSDVPLGAALSGGIDSSAVVCAIRHLAPDQQLHTFSYVAEGTEVNEERWADLVNRHVGAIAHKVIVSPQELVRDIDDMIRAQGEPFGSMSIYAQYRVYHLAQQNGITVTLDGQGADEAQGGYIGFPGERIHSLLDDKHFSAAAAFLKNWSAWPGRNMKSGLRAAFAEMSTGVLHEITRSLAGMNKIPDWIHNDVIHDMGIGKRVGRYRSGRDAHGRRLVAQMANMLTRHGLPALLRHGDRNSMHFSVESRVPFLTLDMVNFMLSMPEQYLVSPDGETKHLFRAAMKGIVPDEVLRRKDKIGFEPPERAWVISIAKQAREWLSEDMQIPFIRREVLLAHFDDVITGRRAFSWQVWRWINFYRWKACFANG